MKEFPVADRTITHQPSPEVRDFLVFYLLEQASKAAFPPSDLGLRVARDSGGDLRPAAEDIRAAQLLCWERGWLEASRPDSDLPVSLSREGRAEIARRTEAERRKSAHPHPREEAAKHLISLLSPPDEQVVLDVGTGDGFLAKKLAAAGFRVLGIDTDASAVRPARSAYLGDSALQFEVADVRDLAERGRRWSKIATSYCLHECADPVATLEAICACLNPGGTLACMDFAPNCTAYLSRAGSTPFHPFRALAEGDWRHLAPDFGLTRLQFFYFGYVALVSAEKVNRNLRETKLAA